MQETVKVYGQRVYSFGRCSDGTDSLLVEVERVPEGYRPLPGGYAYARLRVGMCLRNPAGRDVYVQPGDDESAMWEIIAALDECDDPRLAAHLADMNLSDYFG